MSHPLDGPRLKIERAGKHLNNLERHMRLFREKQPEVLTHQPEPDAADYVYYRLGQAPASFGLFVGDFAHNLRSALDHLAWQLALLTTKTPGDRTEFPIFEKEPEKGFLTAEGVKRRIGDIPDEAQRLIEALQPYHRPEGAQRDPLWQLHRLDVIDKHRLLVAQATHPTFPLMLNDRQRTMGQVRRLDDGTIVLRVPGWANPQQTFEPHYAVGITFLIPVDAQGGVGVGSQVLRGIYDAVRDDVVPRFAHLFSKER
jgi:hypothetical protein